MMTIDATTEDIQPLPIPGKLLPIFSGSMPLPPSVNGAYKIVRAGDFQRIGPTPALEQFKRDAALTLTQAQCDWSTINAVRESKRKVPLAVTLRVYFSTEWKRDLDDVVKYAIDAAFTRMQLNDNLIIQLEAEKLVDIVEPRVEIDVRCVVR